MEGRTAEQYIVGILDFANREERGSLSEAYGPGTEQQALDFIRAYVANKTKRHNTGPWTFVEDEEIDEDDVEWLVEVMGTLEYTLTEDYRYRRASVSDKLMLKIYMKEINAPF